MFSLSNIIRIYVLLSIVVLIGFFVMVTSVDVVLTPTWSLVPADIKKVYDRLYMAIVVMSLIAIIVGIIIYTFVFNRGINKYRDLIKRFDQPVVKPSAVRFPDSDEFGNLGAILNRFMEKLDHYDQIKTSLAQSENAKFTELAHDTPYPILVVSMNAYEPFVSFYNTAFRDMFLKKSIFIDINGKPQTQYYTLDETPLPYLTIKNEEQSPFLSDMQIRQLKNNELEKKHTLTNMSFTEFSGDKDYIFDTVSCIPVIDYLEQNVSQVMYIFMGGREDKKAADQKEDAGAPV